MTINSLHTGYSGLAASQLGIDTASHNVANANTEGFTRQRIEQSTNYPRDVVVGQIGQGVTVDDITRARDAFLDDRVRGALSSKSAMETSADLLSRAETILGEPEFGISAAMDDLFSSFEDLSLDPTDQGRRIAVLNDLASLTGRFTGISDGFAALSEDAATRIAVTLEAVNAQLDEIAELNSTIVRAAANGTTPNDLLDRRDLIIDELSESLGVQVRTDDTGVTRVSLNGLALVDGTTSRNLTWDDATQELLHTTGTALTAGGRLGGLQSFIGSDLPAIQTKLDDLAIDLTNALNTTHAAGFSDSGIPGIALLSYNPTDPAATLAVAITDPAALAASDTDATPFPVHNGENARDLAALRETLTAAGGTQSLTAAARVFVTDIGGRTAAARRAASTQTNLAQAAELSRAAAQGVNVDEELIDLIKYQRAYEAAARVITTADQMLDTLINRTGIVGR